MIASDLPMDDLWTAWTWIAEEAIIAMAAPNAALELKSLTSFPPPPEKGKTFTSMRGRGTNKSGRNRRRSGWPWCCRARHQLRRGHAWRSYPTLPRRRAFICG